MSSKQLKIDSIIKSVKKITPEMLVEIVNGVKSDISLMRFDMNELVTPLFTVKDILEIEGWRQNEDVITEMVQAAAGRAIRMLCVSKGVEPSTDLTPFEIKRIASQTDKVERRAVIMLLKPKIQ